MTEIAFTKVRLPYGWLGNMSPHPVAFNAVEWRTTEALFQALRLPLGHPGQELIRAEKSPMGAKMKAKTMADQFVVEPKSEEDCNNMMLCLGLKLTHNPQLIDELIATGDARLIEDCSNRPHGSGLFWGASKNPDGTWTGQNMLGELWMILRERVRLPE